VTIARSAYDEAITAERERYAFVSADGASRPRLDQAVASFPDVKLQSKSDFQTDQSAWVDQILGIFYVLLGLAVIVSLFGIVNTLALSVLERTRELGMLRAIGMSRRQVRRMIRHESVVTALIGAVLGIGVSLFLAGLATSALSNEGLRFAVPVGSLAAFTVVGGGGRGEERLPATRRSRRPLAARSSRPSRTGCRASPPWPASGSGRPAWPPRSCAWGRRRRASGPRCPRARS